MGMDDRTVSDLAVKHMQVLQMAVRRTGFAARMPVGGQEAIDDGVVVEADPSWMTSDDVRHTNGFNLTELGGRAAEQLDWLCQCGGCAGHAIDGFCPECDGSASRHGVEQSEEGIAMCAYHARNRGSRRFRV